MTRDEIIAEAVKAGKDKLHAVSSINPQVEFTGTSVRLALAAAAARALDLAGELPAVPTMTDPLEPRFAALVGIVHRERHVPGKFNNLVIVGAEAYRRLVIEQRAKGASE